MPVLIAIVALMFLGVVGLIALCAISSSVRSHFEAGQEAVARHLMPLAWDLGPNTPVAGDVLDQVRDLAARLRLTLPDIIAAAPPGIFSSSYAAGARHAVDILDRAVADATPPDLGPAPKAPMLVDIYRRIVEVDNVLLLAADSKTKP